MREKGACGGFLYKSKKIGNNSVTQKPVYNFTVADALPALGRRKINHDYFISV